MQTRHDGPADTSASPPLFEARNLNVQFSRSGSTYRAVRDVSFSIGAGERVGLVGESGSGKSVTALSLTRLVERVGGVIDPASELLLEGTDLRHLPDTALRLVRGRRVGMIFQDPLSSLNPVYSIGSQIAESIGVSGRDPSRKEVREHGIELLERVGIRRAPERYDAYPHEFSGGMRQRVMIAMALASDPDLLIADEPTTALDVTIQRQILDLLDDLVDSLGLSILLITHDLGVVAEFTERLLVMYAGRIVESGTTYDLLTDPHHGYTRALLESVPTLSGPPQKTLTTIPGSPPRLDEEIVGCAYADRCAFVEPAMCRADRPPLEPIAVDSAHLAACVRGEVVAVGLPSARPALDDERQMVAPDAAPLLEVRGLTKRYGDHEAVKDVSFDVLQGEVFGIVGESGSGKSTTARCIAQLVDVMAGEVTFSGTNLRTVRGSAARAIRRDIQVIFQDPNSSLDPRLRVKDILAEPFKIHKLWAKAGSDADRLAELLELVGLSARDLGRYPHEFSGGQRQRIAIARALALSPRLIICDEPVSALDVSVRAGIINLLNRLRAELGLSYVLIAHDLALVRHVCDRIAVMKDGEIVELAPTATLFSAPSHPYTRGLLAAQPKLEPRVRQTDRAATAYLKERRLHAQPHRVVPGAPES